MRRDDKLISCMNRSTQIVRAPPRSVEHGLPHRTGLRLGKLELDGCAACIAQKQQMAVGCSIRIGERVPDEHADRASLLIVPIRGSELVPGRMTPAHILVLSIDLACAF